MRYACVIAAIILMGVTSAEAVPMLQVGVPNGTGGYVPYQTSLTNPEETDTARTSGTTLVVQAAYDQPSPGNGWTIVNIGGKYGDKNWSDFGFSSTFNSAGALLMATAMGSGTLTVAESTNIHSSIYSTNTYQNGFVVPNPPADHAPIKQPGVTYMFFDLGNFANNASYTPVNYATGGTDGGPAQTGSQKTLLLGIIGYEWVHFDLFALATDEKGNTSLKTNLEGNPGSKDVTWIKPTSGDPGGDPVVPEPSTLVLSGLGIAAAALWGRRRKA